MNREIALSIINFILVIVVDVSAITLYQTGSIVSLVILLLGVLGTQTVGLVETLNDHG